MVAKLIARRREYRRLLGQARRLPRTTERQAKLAHAHGRITKAQLQLILTAARGSTR